MPCAFAWPDVIVLTASPHVPTMSYSPRGIGTLWRQHPTQAGSALAEVLGRTRAILLSQLDLPMSTTQLATALALSAPTVSAHLHALQRAGIVGSRRDGRSVRYARTRLGDDLLAGEDEQWGPWMARSARRRLECCGAASYGGRSCGACRGGEWCRRLRLRC